MCNKRFYPTGFHLAHSHQGIVALEILTSTIVPGNNEAIKNHYSILAGKFNKKNTFLGSLLWMLFLSHPTLGRLVRVAVGHHGCQQFLGIGLAKQGCPVFGEDESFGRGTVEHSQ